MEIPAGPDAKATHAGSRISQEASSQSRSDYDSSLSSGVKRADGVSGRGSTKGRSTKPGWLKQVKRWLSVSEPSAQAMKSQRDLTYKKYGIDKQDPQAAEKMHLPIGKVPDGVTTSTKGPSPEKALRERTKEALAKQAYMGRSGSQSVSSGVLSEASSKDVKQIAPWA